MKTMSIHAAGLCLVTSGAVSLAASGAVAETPELIVYTYDSFVSDWGPGPAIEAAFEEVCACDLVFSGGGDGAALLSRVLFAGDGGEADVVLGLDTNLTAQATAAGVFAEHGIAAELDLPFDWTDPVFLPFDFGYFAFVGNAGAPAPASLKELAASDVQIVIQDPRSSTPGLGLLMWVEAAYPGEAASLWADLSDNIVTVTPGWSEAYGLFLEGEADAVLSYTTSPSYHAIAEEDDSKVAWVFDEGHYMQVEVAGILAGSDQPELARQFLEFMLGEGFQTVIPTTNWMFPAVTPEAGLPEGFATPLAPEQVLLFSPEEAQALREPALETWRTALSQ